jgi:hypothetical protein
MNKMGLVKKMNKMGWVKIMKPNPFLLLQPKQTAAAAPMEQTSRNHQQKTTTPNKMNCK